MRNIENQVKQGKEIISRHNRADMSVSECMQLMEPIGEKKDADKIHDQFQFFLRGMSGNMDPETLFVNDLGAELHQFIDGIRHRLFISGDRRGGNGLGDAHGKTEPAEQGVRSACDGGPLWI